MKASTSINRAPKVCIVGSGMSGLLMGIRLKQAGIESFTLLEKASSLGGTWRENTYPGLSCDVPSHYYSYSFDLNPNWSHTFSGGKEILSYFKGIAEKHELLPHIKFNKKLTNAKFYKDQWCLETEDGETDVADILISACGILHTPRMPDIDGIDSFGGAIFHTSRWDHSVELKNKRIGVIGTGSSGVQTIAPLSEVASQLYQFQRTAQWVMPLVNPAYSPLHQKILNRVPLLNKLYHHGFRLGFELLSGGAIKKDGWQRRLVNRACLYNLNQVSDPVLRERLTPSYQPLCKRLVMSNEYYPAIQKENVTLVTDPIECISAEGVLLKTGEHIKLDIIVLATGFYPGVDKQLPHMEGVNGLTLEEAWKEGVDSYRSLALPNFPNFFMLLGPNCPIGNFSVISVAESQADYIMKFIGEYMKGTFKAMAPKAEITNRLNEQLKAAARTTIWASGCHSWYLDKNGDPISWPWSGRQFRKHIQELRLQEYEFAPATSEEELMPRRSAAG